jgi:DNA-binding FadR family transcriptional regulator
VAEQVAVRIGELIIRQGLGDGDSLPNERELTEQFDVARGTLREALRLLENQGVIRIRAGRGGGPVVRRPRPDDLAGSLTLLLQFLDVPFRDAVQARQLLEPVLVAEAARRITPRELRWLQDNLEDQQAAIGDQAAFLKQNEAFHDRLAQLSGNAVLQVVGASLEGITAGLDVAIEYPARTRARILRAHEHIVAALAAGDPVAAGAQASEHLAEFRRFAERSYPELLDRPIRWVLRNGER